MHVVKNMDIQRINFARDSSKSNRKLVQWDIGEMGKCLGEAPLFPYLVALLPGAVAGNHYHHVKRELIVCIRGNVMVILEDVVTKEQTRVELNCDECSGVIVPVQMAHCVSNHGQEEAEILVFATRKAREQGDDFEYTISV